MKIRSLILIPFFAILTLLSACGTTQGERYGVLGAAIGNAITKSERLQPVTTIAGALIGYEYGDRLDRKAQAEREYIAQQERLYGTTKCTTSSSGQIVGGQPQEGKASYDCKGEQTLAGLRVEPIMSVKPKSAVSKPEPARVDNR